MRRKKRAGFTLIELMIVMTIILIVSAVALPTIATVTNDHRLTGAASTTQAAILMARNKATNADDSTFEMKGVNKGRAGFRLIPDPAWDLVRLADGTLDPDYPIAYSRIVPLELPTPYGTGTASVHTDGYPAAFVPLPGRLVLEEAHYAGDDSVGGARVEPTNWYWNVRVGETVEFQGRTFTVCGPMVLFGEDNPEGHVNVGPPGTASPLDRGDGPREYLYLANQRDDDGDGMVDDGWNGQDDDLDGLIDEDDEWEAEAWTFATNSTDRKSVV